MPATCFSIEATRRFKIAHLFARFFDDRANDPQVLQDQIVRVVSHGIWQASRSDRELATYPPKKSLATMG